MRLARSVDRGAPYGAHAAHGLGRSDDRNLSLAWSASSGLIEAWAATRMTP
jgi:hypothetical protein